MRLQDSKITVKVEEISVLERKRELEFEYENDQNMKPILDVGSRCYLDFGMEFKSCEKW